MSSVVVSSEKEEEEEEEREKGPLRRSHMTKAEKKAMIISHTGQ